MERKFVFKFKMNKEIFADMVKILRTKNKSHIVLLVLAICLLVVAAFEAALADTFSLFALLMFAFLLFMYAFSEKLAVKNTLKLNDTLLDKENEITFSEEATEQDFGVKYMRQVNSLYTDAIETDGNFCLFEGPSKMILIPKNSITEGDIPQFKGFLEEKLGKPVMYVYLKKGIRRPLLFSILISVAAFFMAFICLVGGFVYRDLDRVYDFNDYSITLTNGFEFTDIYESNEFNAYYNDAVSVSSYFYSNNEITEYYGNMPTLEQYAKDMIESSSYEITDVKHRKLKNDAYYVTYKYEDYDGYYCGAYVKASDGIWYFTFYCDESDRDQYEERFKEWAESITVNK